MADKPRIFVSHIHEEAALANVIKSGLEDAFADRLAVFVSSNAGDNPGGRRWMEKIESELGDVHTHMLISLVSPRSVREPWISIELGAAWILKRAVFPLCHSGQSVDALPRPLGDFIGADLASNEAAAALLVGAVEKATGLPVPRKWPREEFLNEMRLAADSYPASAGAGTNANKVVVGNKRLQEAHIDLEPEEVRILQLLAFNLDHGHDFLRSEELSRGAHLSAALIKYHAGKLADLLLIHISAYALGTDYKITPAGIGWLKDHRALLQK